MWLAIFVQLFTHKKKRKWSLLKVDWHRLHNTSVAFEISLITFENATRKCHNMEYCVSREASNHRKRSHPRFE
jgi:ribosomal 30S subunit maturation factor RimM